MFDMKKLAMPVEVLVCDDGILNPGEILVNEAAEKDATHRLVDVELYDLMIETVTQTVAGQVAVGEFRTKAHQLFHRDDPDYGDRDQPPHHSV